METVPLEMIAMKTVAMKTVDMVTVAMVTVCGLFWKISNENFKQWETCHFLYLKNERTVFTVWIKAVGSDNNLNCMHS